MVHLSLAVAAKGTSDPSAFFQALDMDSAFAGSDIDVHIAHDRAMSVDCHVGSNVYFHPCPLDTPVYRLWGVAIARSASDYVAVLDLLVPPGGGWLARVQSEIRKGTPLFFGPVEPGVEWFDRRMVGYLAEYVQFSSPLHPHLDEAPGNNIVFQRRLGGSHNLETYGFFKTFMIWQLQRELGIAPQAFNDMPVVYRKDFSLRHYLSMRVKQGRTFSSRRHKHPGQPPKVLCIGFIPFLPFARIWRILTKSQPRHHRAVWRNLHLLVLSETAWSIGEFLGYVTGRD
jgi:hypothetical protein